MFTSPKYSSYRNPAQLLFLTELTAQPLVPLAVTPRDRGHKPQPTDRGPKP